jgi:K+-sensing histidine kinase KdpD
MTSEIIAGATLAAPRYLIAIAAVAGMSLLIGFVEGAIRIANISMLYLIGLVQNPLPGVHRAPSGSASSA